MSLNISMVKCVLNFKLTLNIFETYPDHEGAYLYYLPCYLLLFHVCLFPQSLSSLCTGILFIYLYA